MTAKGTNYTLGEDSTAWLTYTMENFLTFMPYPLGLLVIFFILYFPVILAFTIVYIGAIYMNICKTIGKLPDDPNCKQWKKNWYIHATVATVLGKVWHGYEVCGMDNIPEGPAVLVYYHGGLPVDYYLFVAALFRKTGRVGRSVVERLFFLFPGLKTYSVSTGCGCWNRKECVALLKKGHLLCLAPGGLREQNNSDNNYQLIWGKRQGFAQIAIEAKVPVIPFFTQNIREGYQVFGNIGPMRWLYERTRLLIFPVLGPFPVKLRTHIGEPIPYDPNVTAEELFEKVKAAVEALRDKHQKIPGSLSSALWERFTVHRKEE